MRSRPDSPAILGLLALAAVLSVGALVLIGLERPVPPEVWALVAGAVGAVGGWVGKPAPVAEVVEVSGQPVQIPVPTPELGEAPR